jgi:E3 ubiquitin-protein ligase BAH
MRRELACAGLDILERQTLAECLGFPIGFEHGRKEINTQHPLSNLSMDTSRSVWQPGLLDRSRREGVLEAISAQELKANTDNSCTCGILVSKRHGALTHTTHHGNLLLDKRMPGTLCGTESERCFLAHSKHFFDKLDLQLNKLEALVNARVDVLEREISDFSDMIVELIKSARENHGMTCDHDGQLHAWRQVFRVYMEMEHDHGALDAIEQKRRLRVCEEHPRSTGLLAKAGASLAQPVAYRLLDVIAGILNLLHFEELNAVGISKILKKFEKHTGFRSKTLASELRRRRAVSPSIVGERSYGWVHSGARHLKVKLAVDNLVLVPLLGDWTCSICYKLAWRPVVLGCCCSIFCVRCIVKLRDVTLSSCPHCSFNMSMETDEQLLSFEAIEFLEKQFPDEVKNRQMENERTLWPQDSSVESKSSPTCTTL